MRISSVNNCKSDLSEYAASMISPKDNNRKNIINIYYYFNTNNSVRCNNNIFEYYYQGNVIAMDVI